MKHYQIPFPADPKRRAAFLHDVLHIAGGYTILPDATGAWRDPETGKVHVDAMDLLQVATDSVNDQDAIMGAFLKHFPEQKTVMVAHLGDAYIFPNV